MGYGTKIEDLRDAARPLVAAACCAFLHEANTAQERWDPYRSWAREMTSADTIVTFNYDRVLELLQEHLRKLADVQRFQVFVPSDGMPNGPGSLVLKMHGSVDWWREGPPDGSPVSYALGLGLGDLGKEVDPEFALHCRGDRIGIATPGPSKRISTEELRPVWDAALQRIKDAQVIVFVGYRFPPSDAEAREKLLGAIRENKPKGRPPDPAVRLPVRKRLAMPRINHLDLHVVLGPKQQQSDDVLRLQQLLKYTVEQAGRRDDMPRHGGFSYRLWTHALYAEDFFTVWHRGLLSP